VAELLSHLPLGLISVMDRWMVHRSCAKRLQRRFSDVDVEWLPSYAPDLNPAEQVWNRSKYTDLADYISEDISELEKEVCKSISHMCSHQSLLRSFFEKTKLKLRFVPLLMQRSIVTGNWQIVIGKWINEWLRKSWMPEMRG